MQMKTLGATAVVASLLGFTTARADQSLTVPFNMPIQVSTTVNEIGCNNSPGPQITISGVVALGGLQAQLLFENNVKGTHQTVVTFETNVVLLAFNAPITIPKQPVLGGVGGNPLIWIQLYDNNGKNLTDQIFLGRCVQGLTLNNSLVNQAIANVIVSASVCDNNPGPYITFGGDLSLSGINARFTFQNNLDGTHTATATSSVTLVGEGTPVTIPKQPVLGGSGGNPLVFIQFKQGDGTLIGTPVFLGRCNQI